MMAVRSMGVKALAISSRIGSTDTYDTGQHSQQSDDQHNTSLQQHATASTANMRRNSRAKRPRARMQHFRPRIPDHYICPITQELMTEPVILSSSGHTFERRAIAQWLDDGNTINPLTGEHLDCIDIKPNYALSDALREFRCKLASELFRITYDEDEKEERLCYRHNVLFAAEKDSSSEEDEKRLHHDEHINEHDGYITDDEQELIEHDKNDKKRRRGGCSSSSRRVPRNIPILAFMGPNNIGKSTLLNLIVGEPVFVTMDELSDYDSLCKAVRFKIVNRAHRQFILLDVEGLFPHAQSTRVDEAVMKIFYAVYAISSVIIWNDTNETNPVLQTLLRRADAMMHDVNADAEQVFQPFAEHMSDMHATFAETPDGSLLPEQLRQLLLKKYRKLCDKQNTAVYIGRGGRARGVPCTHKPAFVFLRRDFVSNTRQPRSSMMATNDVLNPSLSDTEHTSPWLSSDSASEFVKQNSSPSTLCLSADSNHNPVVALNDSVSRWTLNDSAAEAAAPPVLSMVDELREEKDATNIAMMSDSSAAAATAALETKEAAFGDGTSTSPHFLQRRFRTQRKSHSMKFGEYVRTHAQFAWLRRLRLFSSVDGVVLPKLQPVLCDSDCDEIDDSDCDGVDERMLHVLPKLDQWINAWCQSTRHIVPLVHSHAEMVRIVQHINRYDMLSSVKYVEDCLQVRGSRLPKYFYYDAKERTLHEMKMIAERFKWDNTQLLSWFEKHFNRLWYFVKDFPNAQHALLFQALCCQQYVALHALDGREDRMPLPMIPTIVMNLCHFYYQISNKVDLYGDIVSKSISIGKFAGASLSGLGSLSLMSVIHPILGFAAVPFSIHIGSSLGANSGAKVGDAIANSKAHFVDGTERYDLGKEYHE